MKDLAGTHGLIKEAATRVVLYEKDVLRNFTKFTEKHLCVSFLGLRPATL